MLPPSSLSLSGWWMQGHSVWEHWAARQWGAVVPSCGAVRRGHTLSDERAWKFTFQAESFFCVYSVSQPSVCELVLTAGGVSHLRDCQNLVLMVIYPCMVLLEKCQMGTKCFQTSISQWWLCDIAVGQRSQVDKSSSRRCKGSLEAKVCLLLHPLATDRRDLMC